MRADFLRARFVKDFARFGILLRHFQRKLIFFFIVLDVKKHVVHEFLVNAFFVDEFVCDFLCAVSVCIEHKIRAHVFFIVDVVVFFCFCYCKFHFVFVIALAVEFFLTFFFGTSRKRKIFHKRVISLFCSLFIERILFDIFEHISPKNYDFVYLMLYFYCLSQTLVYRKQGFYSRKSQTIARFFQIVFRPKSQRAPLLPTTRKSCPQTLLHHRF